LGNAYHYWGTDPASTPFGAIIETLLTAAVQDPKTGKWVIAPPKGASFPDSVKFPSPWGDLAYDPTWVNIENAAKQLWLQKVESILDVTAQFVVEVLAYVYQTTARDLQPIVQPTLEPVIPEGYGLGGYPGNGFGLGGIGNEIAQMNN